MIEYLRSFTEEGLGLSKVTAERQSLYINAQMKLKPVIRKLISSSKS